MDSYFCRPIFGFLSGIKSQSTRDRRRSAEFSRPTCAPVSVAQQPFGFLLICGIRLDLLALLFRSRHVCPVLVCPSLRRHSSSATRTTDSVRPLVLCSSLRCAPTDDELPGLVSNSHLHKSLSGDFFMCHGTGDTRRATPETLCSGAPESTGVEGDCHPTGAGVGVFLNRGRPAPEGRFPFSALRARALGSWDSTGDPRPKGAKPVSPIARRVSPDCWPEDCTPSRIQ